MSDWTKRDWFEYLQKIVLLVFLLAVIVGMAREVGGITALVLFAILLKIYKL
jgi:uncharacterized membrane protein YcjF (UPF0283 family)